MAKRTAAEDPAVELARSLAAALDDRALKELATRLRPFLMSGERESPTRRLLSSADAARYAGVNVETVRRAIRSGALIPAARIGRSSRLTQAAVDSWLGETLPGHLQTGRRAPRRQRRNSPRPKYSLLAQFTQDN